MMAAPLKPRPLRLRFHAVTVVAGANACAQAKALKDVRLLSLEAPRLPLVGCTRSEDCQCKYQHHADRRSGARRSGLRNVRAGMPGEPANRRRLLGRRDSDYDD
jgi:hypothetical protein